MIKVLIVDDDSAIHLIASAALQRAGSFKITFARTGQQGLLYARGARPDLILLDQMMPDMLGEDVLYEIRKDDDLRDIPVVFLTGKDTASGLDYKRFGAQGLIPKPFDPEQLASQIRSLLDLPEPEENLTVEATGESCAMPAGGSLDRLRVSFIERGLKQSERLLATVGPQFDVDAARRIAHLWLGRGGTLGHPGISDAAAALEGWLGVDEID